MDSGGFRLIHSVGFLWIRFDSLLWILVDSNAFHRIHVDSHEFRFIHFGGFRWVPVDSGEFLWGGLRRFPVDSNGMCLIHSGRFCNTYSCIVNTAEVLVASMSNFKSVSFIILMTS